MFTKKKRKEKTRPEREDAPTYFIKRKLHQIVHMIALVEILIDSIALHHYSKKEKRSVCLHGQRKHKHLQSEYQKEEEDDDDLQSCII